MKILPDPRREVSDNYNWDVLSDLRLEIDDHYTRISPDLRQEVSGDPTMREFYPISDEQCAKIILQGTYHRITIHQIVHTMIYKEFKLNKEPYVFIQQKELVSPIGAFFR